MPQNKREHIAARRHEVSRLYLQGMPMFKIAERVGVSTAQITQDMKVLHENWKKDAIENINEAKVKQVAQIDQMIADLYEQWELSKKGETTNTRMRNVNDKGKKIGNEKQIQQKREGTADPRFMMAISKLIDQRSKILGLTDNEIVINNINISPKEWVK